MFNAAAVMQMHSIHHANTIWSPGKRNLSDTIADYGRMQWMPVTKADAQSAEVGVPDYLAFAVMFMIFDLDRQK